MFLKKVADLPYDPKNLGSIITYSKLLLEKSLLDVIDEKEAKVSYGGKGGFGSKVEEKYYFIENNSNPSPDFQDIGVELKVTGLKTINSGEYRPKERLVLGKINFHVIVTEEFETSSFLKKNEKILMVFYLWEKGRPDYEYVFKHVLYHELSEEDLEIIAQDWESIKLKCDGQAHLLSESDTLYLGACTKGQDSSQVTTQPNGPDAKPRAFSFKQSYITFILDDFIKNNSQSVIKPSKGKKQKKTLEQTIVDSFLPYYGKTEAAIKTKYGLTYSKSDKAKANKLAKAILGITKNHIAEFKKAGITSKTITLEKSGAFSEEMSFGQIRYKDIIHEDWENSRFYQVLSNKMFLIIFQKDNNGDLRLKKVMFWNMPESDLEIVEKVWSETKEKIKNNDFNNFVAIRDKRIAHVRTKGTDSTDLMDTPFGTKERKRAFWLNSSYLKGVI
jgi:DNA mismatch repair protein MutH